MHYDYAAELQKVHADCFHLVGQGKVADYIPELARVNPNQFGVCLHTVEGETHCVGDVDVPFSIQSISKVLVLSAVLAKRDTDFRRVHVEPSGDPFNSLVQLEFEHGIPRNPLINAGALVMTDMLMAEERDAKQAILDILSRLCGGATVGYNAAVAQSEIATAARNRALAHLMASFGNVTADVEELLDVYCHHCAIEMTLRQLVKAFSFLAAGGEIPGTGEALLTPAQTKRVLALMLTCGFYDESGEFAYRVGLPGKSGVGGGILTALPGRFTLATWSPGLNTKGNSLVGMKALEMFTSNTQLSLFRQRAPLPATLPPVGG